MKENEITVTECFRCGTRYQNYFNGSPCCASLMVKVDYLGNRTKRVFLSSLSLPKPDLVGLKIARVFEEKIERQSL